MSRTKRLFVPLSPYEQQAMETLLEKQAAQGWLLTKMGSWFWTFEKTDPRPLQFAVTYFSRATEYDPLPTDGQQDKEALCAQRGWHLAARRHDLQVFYTADADAPPLETDPVVRVESIYRAMVRLTIRPRLFTAALCLFWMLLCFLDFRKDAIRFLCDSIDVITMPVWGLMFLACLVDVIACLAWHPKAYRMAEEAGTFLQPRIPLWVSWFCLAIVVILYIAAVFGSALPPEWFLVWLCICAAAIGGGTLMRNHLRRKKYPSELNKAATGFAVLAVYVVGLAILMAVSISSHAGRADHVVADSYESNGRTYEIYNDSLPLSVTDLMETDAVYSSTAFADSSSPLLRQRMYDHCPIVPQYAGAPAIWYTIYDTDFDFVQDIVVNQLLDEHQNEVQEDGTVFTDCYVPIDSAPCGAESAYQLRWSTSGLIPQYLLCWPGRVVELSFAYLEPSEEQLAKAAELLAP